MRQIGLCGLLAALVLPGPEKPAPAPTLVYVGTYARDEGKGIHLFRLQPEGTEVFQNVTLVPLGLAADTPNPSFLEVDAKRRLLFAVNEIDEFEGRPTGAVSAFSIDAAGKLTLLSQRPSQGKSPSHLVLDPHGPPPAGRQRGQRQRGRAPGRGRRPAG